MTTTFSDIEVALQERVNTAITCMPSIPVGFAAELARMSERELLYTVLEKVSVLQQSHDEIKGHVDQLVEIAEPMLDQVSERGIMSLMTGVRK